MTLTTIIRPNVGQPKYTHDCQTCVFIGRVNMAGEERDAYYHHSKASFASTVILRYGSEGPDYWSCAVDMLKTTAGPATTQEGTRVYSGSAIIALWVYEQAKLRGHVA